MTIQEFLKETGMSLNALSHATGISYPTLHGHITGKSRMKADTAERLQEYDARLNAADVLGLKPARKGAAA